MNWFSMDPGTFPNAVQNALLPAETLVHGVYQIQKPLYVSGAELTYLALHSESKKQVWLRELLPMRWCMRGEEGTWTPYHEAAQEEFVSAKSDVLAHLERLQEYAEESAIEPILEVFEAQGTIWFVTEATEFRSLTDLIRSSLFTPQEAIELLAPVMDTLAGLHAESVYHGSISPESILIKEDSAVLINWTGKFMDEAASAPTAEGDVQELSRLLYRMMTGECVYQEETSASLPPGIRAALRMGIETPEAGMEAFWQKLHRDSLAKRNAEIAPPAQQTLLRRLFTPAFTAVFCVICCLIPLVLGAMVLFGGKLGDASYVLGDADIRVPELLYLTQEEAVQKAEELGLHVIIAAREDNPTVPVNSIVTQNPSAGAVLQAGDTIQLVVSDGWSNYVPNVCNLLLEDAKAALEQLGFIVEYKEVLSTGNAPGTVMSQSIKPDTDLPRDSVIRLTVSLGREDLDRGKLETVGNYVGMSFEEAKLQLSELYLYAFQVEAVYDPLIPEGVVISQEIPEGRRVPQGTIINMVVSLGVETVRVPHVVLMNAATARAMLEEAGLKAVIIYEANDGYSKDSVISQGTPGGELVPIGSEVWLTVSTGTPNTVISTGGWSGGTLPTVPTTVPITVQTEPSEAVSETATEITEETEPSTTVETTEQTDVTETNEIPTETEPTEPSTAPPSTTAVQTTEMTITEPPTTAIVQETKTETATE